MRIKNGLIVGVILLFFGIVFQPAIAEQNEVNNIQEEAPTYGSFCILRVYTYCSIGGYLPEAFCKLKCEDLNIGSIRYGMSGFFGYKFFIGLKRGHTYKITATEYPDVSVDIELLHFWNKIAIKVWEMG